MGKIDQGIQVDYLLFLQIKKNDAAICMVLLSVSFFIELLLSQNVLNATEICTVRSLT